MHISVASVLVWSKVKNWNYVALSRVQTRKGLFLARKLDQNTDFSMPGELKEMMTALRRKMPNDIEWNLQEEEHDLELRRRTYSS